MCLGDVILFLFLIYRENIFIVFIYVVMVIIVKFDYFMKGGINLKLLNDFGYIYFCYED